MGDEALCTCGHTRGMHDICHFDHNECLCGCREFIPAAHMAAPDELTALREQLDRVEKLHDTWTGQHNQIAPWFLAKELRAAIDGTQPPIALGDA